MSRPPHLPALKRVGHKGAGHVVLGNTVESFEATLAQGIDMIEFDVLRLPDGRLVLAHDYEDAASRQALTLDEALDHFAHERFAGVELDVDLKRPGYEREVVAGLLRHGLGERALVSSTYLESLEAIGALAPEIRRGWAVPRVRRDYTKTPLAPLAYAVAWWLRVRLPRRAAALIEQGRCEAVMAHWRLVGPRLVQAVHAAGGKLYVWTVDRATRIDKLEAIGVDGVITNDPRLFSPPPS